MPELPEDQVPLADVGSRLLQARKVAERELGDLSAELHISVEHLRAIEDNRFDGLGGPTFVKSYIRSYARAFALDSEPLIKLYLAGMEPEHHWDLNRHTPRQRDYRLLITVGTVLVSTVVASLFVIWLLGPQGQNNSDSPKDVTEAPDWVPEVAPGTVDATAASAVVVATPRPDVASSAAVAPEPDDRTIPATDNEASTHNESAPSSREVQQAKQARSNPEEGTVDVPDEMVSSDSGGDDRVQISLSADSWIEIYDAGRAKLLHGLYKSGAVKNVEGKAPFQVFLGNAPGAKIKLNNKDFDVTSYIRPTNTARFALVNP